jgi:hypothetical protein
MGLHQNHAAIAHVLVPGGRLFFTGTRLERPGGKGVGLTLCKLPPLGWTP